MINRLIAGALNHSPRHRGLFIAALHDVRKAAVGRAARICAALCQDNAIADFPNPFRGTDQETEWADNFAGHTAGEPEPGNVSTDDFPSDVEPPRGADRDWSSLSKKQIIKAIKVSFDVDLNMSMTKDELIVEAERLTKGG